MAFNTSVEIEVWPSPSEIATTSPRSTLSFLSERGVEAIELAIILPVFIGLLFGSIDIARLVASYSAVRAAVSLGGRQAVGMQRPDWSSVTAVVGTEDEFDTSSGSWSSWQQVPALWSGTNSLGDINTYQSRSTALNLDRIYKLEVRAIAYANTVLTEALGQVDYPCSDQAGCAVCFTIRGDPELYQKYFSVDTGGGIRFYAANMLALECQYNVPITSAVAAMGWLPEFVTVSARIYVPVTNYTGAVYDGSAL